MTRSVSYSLVYILSYQEVYTPLVKSQLFEQAFEQLTTPDSNKPNQVQVWIITPFRAYWDNKFISYLKELRIQFSGLTIKVIGGIDRIKKFPETHLIYYNRRKLPLNPVIFHFRGDDLLPRFNWLKKFFPKDQHVVDIRGLWPAEYLLQNGIEIEDVSELYNFPDGQKLVEQLESNLLLSDALTCVSPCLEHVLKSEFKYKNKSWVVPCAVKLMPLSPGVESEDSYWTVGYLGGVATYQNLEDLVLPFLDCLHRMEPKVRIQLITHQPEEMKFLIKKYNWSSNDVEILSVPQSEVSLHLNKMDLGLMIRKKNLVNLVAQPVKIGEYLASGVPVVFQKGLGGLTDFIEKSLLQVDLSKFNFESEAGKVLDFLNKSSKSERRNHALRLAEEFSWQKNAKIHRIHYLELITN